MPVISGQRMYHLPSNPKVSHLISQDANRMGGGDGQGLTLFQI